MVGKYRMHSERRLLFAGPSVWAQAASFVAQVATLGQVFLVHEWTTKHEPNMTSRRTRITYHEAGHSVLSAAFNAVPSLVAIRNNGMV